MSKTMSRHLAGLLVSCVAAVATSSSAHAGGLGALFDRGMSTKDAPIAYEGSMKDAPAPACGREWSANVALTTDYVFRGFSQTDEHPAIQGGFDFSWCRFYAGVWGSSIDFGGNGAGGDVADLELNYYGGIKQKFLGAEFDFGAIYYNYPAAFDDAAELDYFELKAAVGYDIGDTMKVGGVVYWSPEYTGDLGKTWFLEANAERQLFKHGRYEFVASGMVGFGILEDQADADYTYWNAGLTVNVDKFSLDVRYWDTDNSDTTCDGSLFQCDARVVGTISASF